MVKTTAVYALTPQGAKLARMLAAHFGGIVCLPERMAESGEQGFSSLRDCVAEGFGVFSRHIFIAATGIVVRCIAPHIKGKDVDPAVIVLDQKGQFVISLLSGHLGGANELANEIAGLTNGTAVVTTATDTEGLPSIDTVASQAGCIIYNLDAVKHINGALLAGETVLVEDPADILQLQESRWADSFEFAHTLDAPSFTSFDEDTAAIQPTVMVTWRDPIMLEAHEKTLILHPRVLHIGIGCKRGTKAEVIEHFVRKELATRWIALDSVATINSVEAKQNEKGLLAAADNLRKMIEFYPAAELNEVEVPNPSRKPAEAVGTASVAEAAALLAARSRSNDAKLVQEKIKGDGVTLAVALEIA